MLHTVLRVFDGGGSEDFRVGIKKLIAWIIRMSHKVDWRRDGTNSVLGRKGREILQVEQFRIPMVGCEVKVCLRYAG